jgi:uncharacterized protein YbjT (DUF2867 family)
MQVMIFGATGMVGQGVLATALRDAGVEGVLTVGRKATGVSDPKLREIVQADLFALDAVAGDLVGYDACCYCLGVSSVGMKEAEYRRLTHDLTLAIAHTLLPRNPSMTFCFVSGEGTDSQGKSMWARVKGQAEHDLLGMGFKGAYMFRPGFIRPMKGVRSKTPLYRFLYATLGFTYPFLKWVAPGFVTTGESLGRAMLRVAREGFSQPVLRTREINQLGG